MCKLKEQFVPYELAVKLREKGFNEICIALITEKDLLIPLRFDDEEELEFNQEIKKHNNVSCIPTPLYQQVIDWFRDEKSKFIYIQCILIHKPEGGYFWGIGNMKIEDGWEHTNYDMEEALRTHKSYYKCLEAAIEQALKLI